MSERKAVTLAGIGTVVLGVGGWLAGIGVNQMSRIGMRYDRR